MRAIIFLLLAAGCSFPELAHAPEGPSAPAPKLSPIAPLVEGVAEPDPEADEELESRADELRKRASRLPRDPIEPRTRRAMETVAGR
jgi:hypothetical protein